MISYVFNSVPIEPRDLLKYPAEISGMIAMIDV